MLPFLFFLHLSTADIFRTPLAPLPPPSPPPSPLPPSPPPSPSVSLSSSLSFSPTSFLFLSYLLFSFSFFDVLICHISSLQGLCTHFLLAWDTCVLLLYPFSILLSRLGSFTRLFKSFLFASLCFVSLSSVRTETAFHLIGSSVSKTVLRGTCRVNICQVDYQMIFIALPHVYIRVLVLCVLNKY